MAYGTESVPKVYKIFGPGNQYVMAAKQLVSLRDVAIDMPAGPSEVEVIADADANPDFIASDFLSQAEHGIDSQAMLLTTDEDHSAVVQSIEAQLEQLPRKKITEQALTHSRIILLKDDEELMDFTNLYAPEHLIIQTKNYAELAEKVENAGSVFLGPYTPESAGDYASEPITRCRLVVMHMLTAASNLDSFVRKMTFQEITQRNPRTGHLIESWLPVRSLMLTAMP